MWTDSKIIKFKVPIWKISWSLTGNYLAVAGADNIIYVYEEKSTDNWEQISEVNENSKIAQ